MQVFANKILILGTGGTIAGKAAGALQAVGYEAGVIPVSELLAGLPTSSVFGQIDVQTQQLAQIDSKDMDWSTWRSLLNACDQALRDPAIAGVVITHGTDTIEETAWFLSLMLPAQKPVVLTCAMRPATSLLSDGPQNLLDALIVAANQQDCEQRSGVFVVAAGQVHAARPVQKVHPYRLNAFSSYEGGPCGYVEESKLRWCTAAMELEAPQLLGHTQVNGADGHAVYLQPPSLDDVLRTETAPWVEIVSSASLSSARAVDALVSAGVQGLVVAGTGNATVHRELEAALQRARQNNIWVWISTRCLEGLPVLPGAAVQHVPAGELLMNQPKMLAQLPPAKARVAMMLALMAV